MQHLIRLVVFRVGRYLRQQPDGTERQASLGGPARRELDVVTDLEGALSVLPDEARAVLSFVGLPSQLGPFEAQEILTDISQTLEELSSIKGGYESYVIESYHAFENDLAATHATRVRYDAGLN